MVRQWLDSEKVIDQIQDSGNYISVELGVLTVNPAKIIGLSRKLEDEDLKYLRQKIKNEGWRDIEPRGIGLILIPQEDKFIVYYGGNHRAIICNELNITEIKAHITAYIDKRKMNFKENIIIQARKSQVSKLYKRMRKYKDITKRTEIGIKVGRIEEKLEEYKREVYLRIKNTGDVHLT
ncbi:hypothetical protein [Paenibacillus polymyxa]|uniref:hypothetical protein n=1 Tax=Paenibacillus polymyxa TaxID=1406 RepID=UPI0004952FC2|nr:hypothetical protein [Paenibacillus polymyxa]